MEHDDGLSLADLLSAVLAEDRDVEVGDAVRRSGSESVVLETTEWIYRFPRDHIDFDRELAILATLNGRLPAAIPRVEWTGRRSRFCAYRKIRGWQFHPGSYQSASRSRQTSLAVSMAEFLVVMHDALSEAEITRHGVPVFFPLSARADLVSLGAIPEEVREDVRDLIARARRASEEVAGREAKLLHNDFTSDNMVFDGPVGRLSGVWDFSRVSIGPPSFDFRFLLRLPDLLTNEVIREYERLTGREIDQEALVISARIGDVVALVRRGTRDDLVRTVLSWKHDASP